jgi:sulfur carrier protein
MSLPPTSATNVRILVNGSPREVPPGTTIADLLALLQMTARHVAVEVNLELVPRAQHAQHELHDDDRLEVVTLVGGG